MNSTPPTDAHRLAEENILLAFKFASNHSRPQEDVLTFAYEGLLRACQKFNPKKAKLGTYAYRWMQRRTNRFLSREDRAARRNLPSFEDGSGKRTIFSEGSFEDDVLERLVRDELRARLPAALDALPAKDREVLSMYFGLAGHEARPHAEIAKRLGISIEGARQRSLRALDKLRKEMKNPGHGRRGCTA